MVFGAGLGYTVRFEEPDVPDTVRFLLIVALLGGAIYGVVWALAQYPPEQTEIIKPLPHERIRQAPRS